jgi:hypothetical protein
MPISFLTNVFRVFVSKALHLKIFMELFVNERAALAGGPSTFGLPPLETGRMRNQRFAVVCKFVNVLLKVVFYADFL